jgi:hypothetical protein
MQKPFIKNNEFQTGMELQSRVGGGGPKINNNHSQRVGLEGTDECGFQTNFPVSVAVKRELTKL